MEEKRYEYAVKLIEDKPINENSNIKPFEMYETMYAYNIKEGMDRIIKEDRELGYIVLRIIHINKSLKGIPVKTILDKNFPIPAQTIMKDLHKNFYD